MLRNMYSILQKLTLYETYDLQHSSYCY